MIKAININKFGFFLCMALMMLTSVSIIGEAHADTLPYWYKGPWYIYENSYNMHVLFETAIGVDDDDNHRYIQTANKEDLIKNGCNVPFWEYFHEDLEIGSGRQDRRLFTMRAANLTPNCNYKIRFWYRKSWAEPYHFKNGAFWTAPDENAAVIGFYAFGDQKFLGSSNKNEIDAVAKTMNADGAKNTFILHTGDMVYNGGYNLEEEDYWKDYFKINGMRDLLQSMPMFTTPGNHDVDKGAGDNHINAFLYHHYFPWAESVYKLWYHRTYGPIQIYSLTSYPMETNNYCSDTNRNYRPYSEGGTGQYEWLESNLKYHDGDWRGWKVVIMHAPIHSPDTCNNQADAKTYLQPLFERYGVDLVLAGHEHYYAHKTVNDIEYFILGGGGAGLSLPDDCKGYDYCCAGGKPPDRCDDPFRVENKHHWAYFQTNGDIMTVDVKDENGDHIVPQFTLDKSPKADFEFTPGEGTYPLTVNFTDKSKGNRHKYVWYFGDGTTSGHIYGSDATTSHEYQEVGVYSPELRIWSAWGVDTKVCHHCVKVSPQADFDGAPLEGNSPLTVEFQDTSEGEATTWNWDFGDGNTSTEQNPEHTYDEHGGHTVKLTVSKDGVSSTMTKRYFVMVKPYAVFYYDYYADNIYFTNMSQGDNLTYQWVIGDDGYTSNEENPVYPYSGKRYRAKLTITDGAGRTDWMSKYVDDLFGVEPVEEETWKDQIIDRLRLKK